MKLHEAFKHQAWPFRVQMRWSHHRGLDGRYLQELFNDSLKAAEEHLAKEAKRSVSLLAAGGGDSNQHEPWICLDWFCNQWSHFLGGEVFFQFLNDFHLGHRLRRCHLSAAGQRAHAAIGRTMAEHG